MNRKGNIRPEPKFSLRSASPDETVFFIPCLPNRTQSLALSDIFVLTSVINKDTLEIQL